VLRSSSQHASEFRDLGVLKPIAAALRGDLQRKMRQLLVHAQSNDIVFRGAIALALPPPAALAMTLFITLIG